MYVVLEGTARSTSRGRRPSCARVRRVRARRRGAPLQRVRAAVPARHLRELTVTLPAEELRLIDAYWRAANYLSVGQIYLLDNPLLREPLRPEHVKPRLLGHFGTTPGLNLRLRAPEPRDPRARPERDLRHRAPATAGPGLVANAYLEGTYSEVYSHDRRGRGRAAPALPPVLVPGRDPEPRRARDAGLDPRGRRARLRARARVRRGVRQPRPARRVRRRRRRGGDRAARDELAREQVPEPAHRRRRAADPAPERLQDREPDRARAHPGARARRAARGLRLAAAASSRATSPRAVHQRARGGARRRARRRSRRSSARRASDGETARPRWPMIVLRTPKGWTGPEGGRRRCRSRARGARTRCRSPTSRDERRSTCAMLEEWLRSYRPEELFDEDGRARARARARSRRGASGA